MKSPSTGISHSSFERAWCSQHQETSPVVKDNCSSQRWNSEYVPGMHKALGSIPAEACAGLQILSSSGSKPATEPKLSDPVLIQTLEVITQLLIGLPCNREVCSHCLSGDGTALYSSESTFVHWCLLLSTSHLFHRGHQRTDFRITRAHVPITSSEKHTMCLSFSKDFTELRYLRGLFILWLLYREIMYPWYPNSKFDKSGPYSRGAGPRKHVTLISSSHLSTPRGHTEC